MTGEQNISVRQVVKLTGHDNRTQKAKRIFFFALITVHGFKENDHTDFHAMPNDTTQELASKNLVVMPLFLQK
jgi:hypothetical protein